MSATSFNDFKPPSDTNPNLVINDENIIGVSMQEEIEIFEGTDEVPEGIDGLTESNDLSVLKSQLSSDELVSDLDIMKTEQLIAQSKLEEEEAQAQGTLSLNPWEILKKGAINLILPFINGMMLGFGEILAHEIGFRYNWVGARVQPARRIEQRRKQNNSQFL